MSIYAGPEGLPRLTDAIQRQALVSGTDGAAHDLAARALVMDVPPNTDIIVQGGVDSDIYFVIEGQADVFSSDRKVAERATDQHFGEMALVEATSTRSATVRSRTAMVVARLSERDFTDVAQKHPILWRRIGIELSRRLRDQAKLYRRPNEHPMVFVGSAPDALAAAKKISERLRTPEFIVNFWSEGIFDGVAVASPALMGVVDNYDACIAVLGPDGFNRTLTLELGILLGGLGTRRSAIVKPKGLDLPTVFAQMGLTVLDYDPTEGESAEKSLEMVADELQRRFLALPPQLRFV